VRSVPGGDTRPPRGTSAYTAPLPEERIPRILVSCGEPSGDLYGAELLRLLKERLPLLQGFGLGGDRLEAQGLRLLAHVRQLAVVGLLEVLSHLRDLRGIFRRVLAEVDRERPDVAVLVDYPDFNLRLARELRRRQIPVVYYVSPQVWAWRRERLVTIRDTVARMLVIFPFEESLYREAGVPVTFVGHPLVDLVRPAADPHAFLRGLGLDPARPVAALLPGSRTKEVAYNLPPLAGAVARIRAGCPEAQFLVALAPSLDASAVLGPLRGLGVTLVRDRTAEALSCAGVALVASGTATVETALLGTPMVVVYRVSPLTYAIGRRFLQVPHFAMVNLIAGRQVVPELEQGDFTPERVAAEALRLLSEPGAAAEMRQELARVRGLLGGPGASARAAEAVAEFLAPR
jgi:lipid-A-disaccharide synthase